MKIVGIKIFGNWYNPLGYKEIMKNTFPKFQYDSMRWITRSRLIEQNYPELFTNEKKHK